MSKFLDSVMQQAAKDPEAFAFRNPAGQSIP